MPTEIFIKFVSVKNAEPLSADVQSACCMHSLILSKSMMRLRSVHENRMDFHHCDAGAFDN